MQVKSDCDTEVSRILHDAYNVTYDSVERTTNPNDRKSGDDARKDALREILGRQRSNDVTSSARPGAENKTMTVARPRRLQVPAIPHELSESPGSVNVPHPGLPRDIIPQSPIEVGDGPSPVVEVAAEREPELESRIIGSAGPERVPTILPELSERPRLATVTHPEPPLNNLPQNSIGIEEDGGPNSRSVVEVPEREDHHFHALPTPPEQRIPFIIHEDDGQEREQISSYDLVPPSIPVIREEEGPSPIIARESFAESRVSTTPFGMREGNVEVPPARRESEYYTPHNLLVVISPIGDEAGEEIGHLYAATPTAFEESDVPIFIADMAQKRQEFEELERTERPSLVADMPQDNGREGADRNSSKKRNDIA